MRDYQFAPDGIGRVVAFRFSSKRLFPQPSSFQRLVAIEVEIIRATFPDLIVQMLAPRCTTS